MNVSLYFSNELSTNSNATAFMADGSAYVLKDTDLVESTSEYRVLILNFLSEKLQNVTDYRSSKQFDAFAFMDESITQNDLIALSNVFEEIILRPGVLQKRQIQILLKFHILLYNPSIRNIKPAKYQLEISNEYYLPTNSGGETISSNNIPINPLSFVIVKAVEICNFPKNICGIFDLRVSLFCQGIILSNGVQVDPGYRGVLLSLLFNSSSSVRYLKSKENFSHLMFLATSICKGDAYDGPYMDSTEIPAYMPPLTPSGFSYEEFKKSLTHVSNLDSKVDHISEDIKPILSANFETRIASLETNLLPKVTLIIASAISILALIVTIMVGSPIASHFFRLESIDKKFDLIEQSIENIKQSINQSK
ncbi:hypothetical protein KM92DES2_12250 [uncultured Desulfovibrio sp.]|uniref:Uncharacterized protein n=1 Tax=uncultured Desulfovibrio sp. TaxID=167968 RepID=A0A212K569_9BACT|nr:hypothetical protein [Desulfovibrio desulfuricans]MCB6543213.1 hypothetical protein [Desulfovibrio desulfuricans]MCB6554332.1 hypothetical protein [Desulfovibrio desulfuricans]MCB6566169.1 hypothetical protein [Desulfovibrio desulfuricans]MCB7347203.1 hypothetical protein [Desulfovibrio desulfuricans]MCQ4861490.1 hypothetical protein [Desulfovibrio desulfuricans]